MLFALGAFLLTVVFLWKSSSDSLAFYPSKAPIKELDGFLYMVSHTDNVLPEDLDVREPISPTVWAPGLPSNSKHWRNRMASLARTPVIVFSKTYCP